jgi:glycoside/pentoside/hexuronide:cation symporter, GPH family
MDSNSVRIPAREKVGYALGDIATNFFFQSLILYQTRYYTDTVGLSAVALGTMFLVLRGADAFLDPLIGALSDRTQTRWGKFRPWILGTAVPFGVIFWLVFATPDFGPSGRLIYAYITYSLVMLMYSANNTPYIALMAVLTPDASERSSIAGYRFVGALLGQFLIQALPLPLVAKLGAGNAAKGWAMTMAIFGGVIIVLNLITFATTRERLQPPPGQKSSLREDVRNVLTNRAWFAAFILTLLVFTMNVVRGSSLNYYFAYYLDPQALKAFLEKFGLGASVGAATGWDAALNALGLLLRPDGSNAAAVGFSLFFVVGSVVQIVGIIFSKPLTDRLGKKAVFITGASVTTAATALVFLIGPTQAGPMLCLNILWSIGWGPTVPLLWLMFTDVADHSEWLTHRRATGFMSASCAFALKVGLGVGGALSTWILNAYGYVPNVAQTERALLGIRLASSIYPALMLVLCIVCLFAYPIGKKLTLRIQNDLAERRLKYASAAGSSLS